MAFGNASRIDAMSATKKVKAYCATSLTAGFPAALYPDASGVVTAFNQIIDGSSRKGQFGILQTTVTSGETGTFVVRGAATVIGGGTSGQLVTAISVSGGVTDATVASGNADLALGMSTASSTLILY